MFNKEGIQKRLKTVLTFITVGFILLIFTSFILAYNMLNLAVYVTCAGTLAFVFTVIIVLINYLITEYLNNEGCIDYLSNLHSRKRLDLDLARISKKGKPVAICYLDFVGFKKINDLASHKEGDKVIVGFGKYVNSLPKSQYRGYRVGGDEFVIIVSNYNDIFKELEDFIKGYKHTIELPNEILDVKFNMGVVMYPKHGNDIKELIDVADKQMYIAKKNGSRIHFYVSEKDTKNIA